MNLDRYLDELPPALEDTIAPLYDALTDYIRALSDFRDALTEESDAKAVRTLQIEIAIASGLRRHLDQATFSIKGEKRGELAFWKWWAESR